MPFNLNLFFRRKTMCVVVVAAAQCPHQYVTSNGVVLLSLPKRHVTYARSVYKHFNLCMCELAAPYIRRLSLSTQSRARLSARHKNNEHDTHKSPAVGSQAAPQTGSISLSLTLSSTKPRRCRRTHIAKSVWCWFD